MSDARTPGYHDADLVLRFYEMRREEVMRKSRDTISFRFWPKTFADIATVADLGHPDNAAWRQVGSYWEMVFGFGRRGIVEPEFLVENSGEGILLWMKLRAFVGELRKTNPAALQNLEWAATQTATGRQKVASFEARYGDKFVKP
ncbi:MAG: hypothetical protein H6825_05155 [Planctomycetes bacterium]|nr:hypothetical protein [Planctomycetota bacterium]